MSEEQSLDESELVVSEEALDELVSSDESVSARLAFFRLSCFRRFCSFLARFFALAFAFFFFSLFRCFLFLASSFRRCLPSLSSSMMTSHISCAIIPMGTSFALFFAIVSTSFDSLRTHFGAPFRFRIRRRLSLFSPKGSSCRESNSISAIVPSSSIGTSVPPARSWGGVAPAPSFPPVPLTCFSSVVLLESTISAVPACVAPWAHGLPPPASGFSTFWRLHDRSFM